MALGQTIRFMLLAAGLAAGQQAFAQRERIVWAMIDWPPFTILQGHQAPLSADDLDTGSSDRMMAEIIRRMPGSTHVFRVTNTQRMWNDMERGENLCYAMAIKTPDRLRYAFFTPAFISPPPALVVHRKYRDTLVGNASVASLAKVLKEHSNDGRLQQKRAYGPQIDAVIDAEPVPIKRELVPTTGALLRPLSAGLFGFTLEYPAVVEYARRTGDLAMPLDVLEISEAPEWVAAQIACTRNDWGKRAITAIDAAVRKAAGSPVYSGALNAWLSKEVVQKNAERIRSYYEARSAGGPAIE